ncbi:MAG TPA: alpha/beta fold hydrolase [Blastocatellia bacterium]|nr:alpha/beta fold hydrolase [Blastocatellia bacterium]
MHTEKVAFYSEGYRLAGVLHLPDQEVSSPRPVIVEGPGWLAVACGSAPSSLSEAYHEGFVRAGFAVLNFDYRGFGLSEGPGGWVRPADQIEDIFSAVTFVETRNELDPRRIGLYGQGGTGGGNAICAAACDERIRCVIVQSAVADGAEWLRRMRREHEWVEFCQRVAANRRRRVRDNEDELVDPREELMVAAPERKSEGLRHGTDTRVGSAFHLASAEALLRYRPIDVVHRIAPRALLITSVEDDVVTPEDHAKALYERAGTPKRLIRQTGVRHYESYRRNLPVLLPQFTAWYERFLEPLSSVTARTGEPAEGLLNV